MLHVEAMMLGEEQRRHMIAAADALADSLLDARLGDDVLALTCERWDQLRRGDDPYWRAIGRDALCLAP